MAKDRFENKNINGWLPYSRVIASYAKYENPRANLAKFGAWLTQLELDKEEIEDIVFLAYNGRLEIEENAKQFLKEYAVDKFIPERFSPDTISF